jgi:hypothetical protein
MQTKILIPATIGVADKTIRGSLVTADETSRGLQFEKRRNLQSVALLGVVAVACLFFALVLIPARAEEDNDIHFRPEDNDKSIRAEIASLRAEVSSLRSRVSDLRGEVGALQTSNTGLQTGNTALEARLAAVESNHALQLGPFVSLNPDPETGVTGPNITFSGANIHIVSGSGMTDDDGHPRGLGNLIIGYDEDPALFGRSPLNAGDRGGSHNLVIGSGHRFTIAAFGGFVAGELNTISNLADTVSGGLDNTASGFFASVSGGSNNLASQGDGNVDGAIATSVSGGLNNTASFPFASVSGGENNTASGAGASVSGGLNNTATGTFVPVQAPSVSGGENNVANGEGASVSGGLNNTANGNGTGTFVQVRVPSVSGGENNTATGEGASVSGGSQNSAGGLGTVVLGGHGVSDNNNNSIAPKPPFP